MTREEYWSQCLDLSRISGERYAALWDFLAKHPTPPLGAALTEHGRLVSEYAETFRDWINFTEEHKGGAQQSSL